MNNRDRFINVLNFKPVDRVPVIEWAGWWNKTRDRWDGEGVSSKLNRNQVFEYFGMDDHYQIGFPLRKDGFPAKKYPDGYIKNDDDYDEIKKYLYPEDGVSARAENFKALGEKQKRGECAVWLSTEGYFWFPRGLFGIEPHLYSFYEQPELYHRICADLAEFHAKMFEQFLECVKPVFMMFCEDMSYNHGPMISEEFFNEFLAPYYKKVIPILKNCGVKIIVDTDGDVTRMIPWLMNAGVEGVLPLERQAGVDIVKIREKHPDLIMIGGYDKMVMKNGEEAMRKEFERLLPVMKKGGYIASVDHQTPPDVSVENYRIFIRLFKEYAAKAGSGI